MQVSDYIFKFLADKGVDKAFMVSGGQAMFLGDALCRNKKFNTVCTHHEQSAGMAAEAYGRITGKPAVALIATGPGSMNIINGVAGAWTDSSPMIVISGQSVLATVKYQNETKIRQYGIQGITVKHIVEGITKYFVTVDYPDKIEYYMEKAYQIATTGRPGPVWIEVPLDVQKMIVSSGSLQQYEKNESVAEMFPLEKQVSNVLKELSTAKRPVLLVGQGVRMAGAVEEFRQFLTKVKTPVLTARLGIDLIESDNELYVGRPGIYGERAANFAVQNADLIISVGCRLASALVGHNISDFGRNAKKIVVDIDPKELDKPGLEIDLKINNDAKLFFREFLKQLDHFDIPDFQNWVQVANKWKKNYPVVLDSYKKEEPVNSYYFTKVLSDIATKDDMILVDTGSCFHVACQTWKIKKNQRFLTTGGLSSMGYWVAGLGACLANNEKRTIVITGDGSFQMNIQELATVKHYNLPMKIFIFNNNGYLLIRHAQKNFLEGRLFGEGPETGVWCPDSLKIAESYGIKGIRIESSDEVRDKIKEVMDYDGPVICDVKTPEWQLIIPRVSSEKKPDGTLVSKPYEDMYPFLEREEFYSNMVVKK
jgi:acetolactate synthase I/II/III large subunit